MIYSQQRNLRPYGILVCVLLVISWTFWSLSSSNAPIIPKWRLSNSTRGGTSRNGSKFAITTLLSKNSDADPNNDEADWYFWMVRTLAYKLLHDPETRSDPPIPFIVLVTKDYEEHKRRRLESYGAEVREVAAVEASWIKPWLPRWKDVMTKLRLWQMTEFDRILFIDADMMILHRLDGVFNSVNLTRVRQNPEQLKDDEAPLPEEYLMAARPELPADYTHTVPPAEDTPGHNNYNNLNGGFMLLKPSLEMFNYYMSVIAIENRFDSGFPEQHMLGYAHRQEGNMPWIHLDWHWNVNWGKYEDVKQGVRSFHARYFMSEYDFGLKGEPKLSKVWWGQANIAKGYFLAKGIDKFSSGSNLDAIVPT